MVVNVGNTGNTGRAAGNAWGVAERYREFSWREVRGRSDAHEELSARISQDAEFCDLLSGSLPAGDKQQPELLLATVRYLDGPHADMGPRGEAAYGRWREWTIRHWDEVRAVIMQRAVQTNEPARCATLLPLLARLPQPLALLEAGTSAGLALHPDRYRYRYEAGGPYGAEGYGTGGQYAAEGYGADGPYGEDRRAGALRAEVGAPESPLVLTCHTGGAADELPDRMPQIVWRGGIDLDPLDPVSEPDDLRWLQALVWPGDGERAARLSAAVEAVRPAPRPRMVRGDLIGELPALAAEAPPEATLVIFHSAVLSYLPPARREEFARLVRSLLDGRPGGGHWVSNEHHSVLPWITAAAPHAPRPDDALLLTLALDGHPVALTGPYGRSLHSLSSGTADTSGR
ncbi:DUF2332 domain-containing protein [Streptomyces tubercidicus]|uniref:DUF2332 domain-containing protein n=1 Tax=Streptomyces tubercidicus TaxID=47759 RepID=A0A640UWU6_9ACTN|nr:DUF2332 domain-containing protein [Streptomyces tubercidicus]WAU13329.1 DUF2332 domain-containing protein [Streptomyces tubercidicus]GFE38915.1 hypothetical protein Stube_35880 [Streptomyces tubercidicus]